MEWSKIMFKWQNFKPMFLES